MQRSHLRRVLQRGCDFLLLLMLASAACGEPYIPGDDAAVLGRVPAAAATRRLQPLHRQLAAHPTDLPAALQLAESYLKIGRETADPRFTSYAQATIEPWLRQPEPPAAMLVLGATVLQSSHEFAQALQLLDRALAIDPRNGQAWLTKATVLQVQGKFPAARGACGNLLRTAGQVIALACIASVDSLNGRLGQSYRSLQRLLAVSGALPDELRGWVLGQLGEMAVRLADQRAAEVHFLAALQATPGDVYLKAAYADLLLGQRRNEEVVALLKDNEPQDVLLLRLAIAGKYLAGPRGESWAHSFAARYQAAQRAGDSSHLREYARFLLDVRGDARQALAAAMRNWQVQREPADVHVYVNAARALQSPASAAEVVAWIRETGYEDRGLQPLAYGKPAS